VREEDADLALRPRPCTKETDEAWWKVHKPDKALPASGKPRTQRLDGLERSVREKKAYALHSARSERGDPLILRVMPERTDVSTWGASTKLESARIVWAAELGYADALPDRNSKARDKLFLAWKTAWVEWTLSDESSRRANATPLVCERTLATIRRGVTDPTAFEHSEFDVGGAQPVFLCRETWRGRASWSDAQDAWALAQGCSCLSSVQGSDARKAKWRKLRRKLTSGGGGDACEFCSSGGAPLAAGDLEQRDDGTAAAPPAQHGAVCAREGSNAGATQMSGTWAWSSMGGAVGTLSSGAAPANRPQTPPPTAVAPGGAPGVPSQEWCWTNAPLDAEARQHGATPPTLAVDAQHSRHVVRGRGTVQTMEVVTEANDGSYDDAGADAVLAALADVFGAPNTFASMFGTLGADAAEPNDRVREQSNEVCAGDEARLGEDGADGAESTAVHDRWNDAESECESDGECDDGLSDASRCTEDEEEEYNLSHAGVHARTPPVRPELPVASAPPPVAAAAIPAAQPQERELPLAAVRPPAEGTARIGQKRQRGETHERDAALEIAQASIGRVSRARGGRAVDGIGQAETPYVRTSLADILSQVRRQCTAFQVTDLTAGIKGTRRKAKRMCLAAHRFRAEELDAPRMSDFLTGLNRSYAPDHFLSGVCGFGSLNGPRQSCLFTMQQKDVTPAPRSTGGSDVAFGAAKANQDDEVSVRGSSHCMPCRMRRTDVHGFSEETAYDRLPNGMIMPETACSNCALRASLSLVDDGDVYRPAWCGLRRK
jgi:hypothetical protein